MTINQNWSNSCDHL